MNSKSVLLSEVKRRLEATQLQYEVLDDRITILNADSAPTVIQIEGLNLLGVDGRLLTHRVTVSKRCTAPRAGVGSQDFLAKWNAFTSIFSAIPVDGGVDIVARVNLFEGGDDVAEHVYAPLICWAAWLAPGVAAFLEDGEPNARSFFEGTAPKVDPSWFGLPKESATLVSPYTQEDLEESLAYARSMDWISTIGEGGISLELPWDKDAKGVLYDTFFGEDDKLTGSRTALVVIELNAVHPLFGAGTLVQYRVPFVAKGDVSPLVDTLNRWDFAKGDLPPFFGSWCLDGSSNSPAYVSFLPSIMGRSVSLVTLVSWMSLRHKAMMTFLRANGLSE